MDCSFKTVMTNLISIVYKTKKTNDNTCIQKIIRFACIDIYILFVNVQFCTFSNSKEGKNTIK